MVLSSWCCLWWGGRFTLCLSHQGNRTCPVFFLSSSPCWVQFSNMENEGATTKCTWVILQNEINNPAAPIYRGCLGLTKYKCLNGALAVGAMSPSCRGEADSLTQYLSNYCLLKENLKVHCLCRNDWTKFLYFCPQQPKEPLCWIYFISWAGSSWEESFLFL